ncbi:MAG: DNA translocase FtsK [Ruminococcaceae bacterium]|nr:DNA translocase FtsK [Oscillospiraceae bacterium]
MPAKKGSAKKPTKKSAKPAANKNLIALILFAVSVFVLAVTFISGENLWNSMHNALFGLFGAITFAVPVYMVAISVFYAMDKLKGSVAVRFTEIGVLVFLLCATIDVFSPHFDEFALTEYLGEAFSRGWKGGGVFGALIGDPLHHAFGSVGAIITVILLVFICIMLVTGTTLITLFKNLSKPVKTVKETYKEHAEERKSARSVVDIPVDDPDLVQNLPKMNEKQRRVITTYKDIDVPEVDTEPVTEENSGSIDEALFAAHQEAEQAEKPTKKSKKAEETEPDQTENIEMESQEYKFPPIDLLKGMPAKSPAAEQAELESTARRLVDTLKSFGVDTRIVDISRGPTVTRYELQPSSGVKISKITNLADDIALNLATAGVRIEAPIPNKAAVGIEVPNKASNVVHIREILESSAFSGSKSKLTVSMGKDLGGNAIVGDISKMPHGLIAGATGSGKSVCINSIIMSILYKARPDEVKLIMVDPKVVELGIYNGIPHLLLPVVTDPRRAASTLGWAVSEMEKRYQMFAASGVRDLEGYNRVAEADPEMNKLPRIVIIVDELADLMMTAPKEVEESINRIAAKARAAGMHLIIATQRPSVDVVTGVIKANIPTRIAFAVSSQIDSRTILDTAGAEKLLGRGDMLFSPIGSTKPSRIQGCFVSDEEVEAVVDFVKGRHTAEYDDDIMEDIENRVIANNKDKNAAPSAEDGDDNDPMLMSAIELVVESGQASTSVLQRRLKLGYARAARIMDEMELKGVVGPSQGAKPRQVLMTKEQLMELKARQE